jgi:flagellar basal body P-ring formation protein FlgA
MRRIATILIFLATAGSAVAQSLDPIVSAMPTLRREATITGDLVRIGDLIENAGTAAGAAIFRAPDLGETGAVEALRVVDAARPYGLIGIDTQGLTEVVVIRPGRIIAIRDIEAAIAHAIAARYGLGDARNLAFTFDREARPIHVEQNAAAELQATRIVFERATGRFDLTFEIPGSMQMRGTTLRYIGSVVETRNVAVLIHALARGDVLKKTDVAVERRPRAGLADDTAEDTDDLVGLAARQQLHAGQPLRTADLVKPQLVLRGDPVTITYEVPGVILTIRGKALESGAEGDLISVVNGQSKRPLQATVTGPGRVTIGTTRIEQAAASSIPSESRGMQSRRTE